jgi:hypothetical protein
MVLIIATKQNHLREHIRTLLYLSARHQPGLVDRTCDTKAYLRDVVRIN